MADELQKQYKEYAKRKKSAFRSMVKKAYNVVMRSYGVAGANHSSSEDVSEESDQEEQFVCIIKKHSLSQKESKLSHYIHLILGRELFE